MSLAEIIQANLDEVRRRLQRAAAAAGRDPAGIRLVAVSKTFGADAVRAAAAAGQREFGENRVQEALQKIPPTADLGIRWHLIGHLQANKARKAAGAFAVVQSVDSVDLVERLDLAAAEAGATPDVFVQVDLAGEAGKHGVPPEGLRPVLEAAGRCRAIRLAGLMLLPPWLEDPEAVRPYFARLRELRDALVASGASPSPLAELSMGMSHDFEVAIAEGATVVRVGTAIFGPRVAAPAG